MVQRRKCSLMRYPIDSKAQKAGISKSFTKKKTLRGWRDDTGDKASAMQTEV